MKDTVSADLLKHYSFLMQVCPDGYYGLHCKETCPFPSYGISCRHHCTCEMHQCNNIKGCSSETSTGKE